MSVICPTNEVDKIITDDGIKKRISRRQKELDIPLVYRVTGEVRMERQQKAYKVS